MIKIKKLIIPIKILWIILGAVAFLGYFLLGNIAIRRGPFGIPVIFLFLILIALWLFLSLRFWFFNKRLKNYFRHILSNDYSTGIRATSWLNDEMSNIAHLANRAIDQLRRYDELRSQRTGMSYRALEVVCREMREAVIIAVIDKQIFRFNPAAQAMFGIKKDTFSFESIEKQEENSRFFRVFLLTTLKEKIQKEGTATLQLPQRKSKKEIFFRIIPLKDESEKVQLAIIFIQPSDNNKGK